MALNAIVHLVLSLKRGLAALRGAELLPWSLQQQQLSRGGLRSVKHLMCKSCSQRANKTPIFPTVRALIGF